MASYTANRVKNQTLSGGTADTITFTDTPSKIRVANRSATNPIYFRVDGIAAVVAADENFVVEANSFLEINTTSKVVSLISSGGQAYSVSVL